MTTRIRKDMTALAAIRFVSWFKLFELWSINFDTRKALKNLDDSQLRDIGIDRVVAEKEAAKPFWKL